MGPKAQTGAWPTQRKGTKQQRVILNIQDFRKNAEHLMCDLTTAWSLSVHTYHNMDLTTFYDSSEERRTHISEWEGTLMLRRERHAHRWPSMVRGAMLARPTRRATYHRALGSGELIPQNGRELRRSEGSGMLKVTLYGEGSNTRSIRRSEGRGMLIGDPLWWGE